MAALVGGHLSPAVMALAFLLSIGLRAAHALSPGHGKALVAAYVLGAGSSARSDISIGLWVAVSHIAGVFALTLLASEFLVPERLIGWLSLGSGIVVTGLGLVLLARVLRGRRRQLAHALAHEHGGDHDHGHDHGHSHEVPAWSCSAQASPSPPRPWHGSRELRIDAVGSAFRDAFPYLAAANAAGGGGEPTAAPSGSPVLMPDTGVTSPSTADGSPIALPPILALVAAVTTVGVRAVRVRR